MYPKLVFLFVPQNLRKWGKCLTLFCSSHFLWFEKLHKASNTNVPDIISAYLMICNVKVIAKKAKITSSQKIIEYKECSSWDYIWTMDINLGSSVAEELTRVAEVLAGFDSHEVHAAMSFPCIYMLIPPLLLQYRYSKIKTMRSECCRAHHQQSVPGLHPQ